MGSGALAAKVGSRLAHVALPMIMPSPAMVASALGAHVVGPAGMGGAGASAVGAGIGRAAGISMISLMDMIPVITTGVIATTVCSAFGATDCDGQPDGERARNAARARGR